MLGVKNLLRAGLYLSGLAVLALGVALSVSADLGVSPVNSIPYVLYIASDIPFGVCVAGTFAVLVLIQLGLERRGISWRDGFQIFCAVVFGCLVDLMKSLTVGLAPGSYLQRLLLLAVSIVLIAVGISLYVDADFVGMPMEELTGTLTRKLQGRMTFQQVKVLLDCAVVAAAAAISLVSLGGLFGVREGTVLCALLVGRAMCPIQRVIRPLIRDAVFDERKE